MVAVGPAGATTAPDAAVGGQAVRVACLFAETCNRGEVLAVDSYGQCNIRGFWGLRCRVDIRIRGLCAGGCLIRCAWVSRYGGGAGRKGGGRQRGPFCGGAPVGGGWGGGEAAGWLILGTCRCPVAGDID